VVSRSRGIFGIEEHIELKRILSIMNSQYSAVVPDGESHCFKELIELRILWKADKILNRCLTAKF